MRVHSSEKWGFEAHKIVWLADVTSSCIFLKREGGESEEERER